MKTLSKEQKELLDIIARLSEAQQKILLRHARQLEFDEATTEELAEIKAGKAEIDRGEWSDWEKVKNDLSL